MDAGRTCRLLLPRPIRRFPADLTAVLVVTVAVQFAVFAPVVRETPFRIPIGLVFLLFVPGYTFVAAIFPRRSEPSTDGTDLDRTGIDGLERVAFSIGASIAIVPLCALLLEVTPWAISLGPLLVSLTGFVLLSSVGAAIRRWQQPPAARFRVPYRSWPETGSSAVLEPSTRVDALLNVVLVASIVLALGAVGFAAVVPQADDRYSAIYVLTEDDDGDLVADDYPTTIEHGSGHELVVGIDNDEHRSTEYTVVVAEQRVDRSNGDGEAVVTDQRELERFETELSHGESWHHPHEIEPTMTGEVRVVWLLYPDDVPTDPSMETTAYHAHLWVTVEAPDE